MSKFILYFLKSYLKIVTTKTASSLLMVFVAVLFLPNNVLAIKAAEADFNELKTNGHELKTSGNELKAGGHEREVLKSIEARYKLKASILMLPIYAKIKVEKLSDGVYQASLSSDGRLITILQTEQAKIQSCNVDFQGLQSKGNRIQSKSWDESVEVDREKKMVSYRHSKKTQLSQYPIQKTLTGFATVFAHQFVSLKKGELKKELHYTQSKKPSLLVYEIAQEKEKVRTRLFGRSEKALKVSFTNKNNAPDIWYLPESLGAFPLKMQVKLAKVLKVDINLVDLDAEEEDVLAFFDEWGCGSALSAK